MTREDLKNYLPHREPMLLVDEVNLNEDGTVTGYYTVRGDEFFLQGHFPDYPIVPGVILCEILAQASAALMIEKAKGKRTLITGFENVRFRGQARPGDKLEIHSELVRMRPPFFFVKGSITVGGKPCMRAEFSAALIDPEQV